MTTIIRQKIGRAKTRLLQRLDEIAIKINFDDKVIGDNVAAVCLGDLQKKINTFKIHVNELETACVDNAAESERFIQDYDEYEKIIDQAELIETKLEIVVKNGNLCSKREEENKRLELDFQREKLKIEAEQETERMKILSSEKIELERLQLEKLEIAGSVEETMSKDCYRNNVNLPKLELLKFNGNIFSWCEFWDSFVSLIHNNTALQPIDKFNYLKVQLEGDARAVISGLELTNANYDVAVNMLLDRYGNLNLLVDAHYSQLREIPVSTNNTYKLRTTVDLIEKHLR